MSRGFSVGSAYERMSAGAYAHTVLSALRKSRYGVTFRTHVSFPEQEPRLVEIMKFHGIHMIKLPEVYAFVSATRFEVLC